MAGLAELAADIMRCASSAKTKKGLWRCGRFLPGPGKSRSRRKRGKYKYTTAKGRRARAKAKRRRGHRKGKRR